MSHGEAQDPLQESLSRLERALNRLEMAARARLESIAAAQSHEVDVQLLNADRQALALAMDEEKAAREISDKLRAQALEKVESAMELVRAALYEADGRSAGANR